MHALQNSQDTGCGVQTPTFSYGRKLNESSQAMLWEICYQQQSLSSYEVLVEAQARPGFIKITVRHLNRLRVRWGVSRPKGRPCGAAKERESKQGDELVHVKPMLPSVGIHLFDLWLEKEQVFEGVVTVLQQAISAYCEESPGESFPLLSHRWQTLQLRFKALFYAPLFEIGKLTEYDRKEHALSSVIGQSYQSSTLHQFLGQLERIDAAEGLMPLLSSEQKGEISYIDGHMIAFWTSRKMHKGKITMLGRIMAGSQAVVTHNEQGQALFFEYYPPDIRMPKMILDYCERLFKATNISLFIIDREINSSDLARAFQGKEWGLLSMLDKNEYKALSSFDVQLLKEKDEKGPKLYRGQWKDEKKRKEDPRHFVLEASEEKVSAFWGTPAVKEQLEEREWPEVYRQRNEVQENSFKRMIAHGALNTNYGTKKIEGPDRHQQRAKAKLTEKITAACKKREKKAKVVEEQEKKVNYSVEKGHTTRLEQRQNRLVIDKEELKKAIEKEDKLQGQLEELKEPKEREDRDFRKQKIMTFRTLFLENLLQMFFGLLLAPLNCHLSIETLLDLLFHRSGGYLETPDECIYWISSQGLSEGYKKTLEQLAQGLTQMQLEQHGKPVLIRVRGGPP